MIFEAWSFIVTKVLPYLCKLTLPGDFLPLFRGVGAGFLKGTNCPLLGFLGWSLFSQGAVKTESPVSLSTASLLNGLTELLIGLGKGGSGSTGFSVISLRAGLIALFFLGFSLLGTIFWGDTGLGAPVLWGAPVFRGTSKSFLSLLTLFL